jgi:hypothetical protein
VEAQVRWRRRWVGSSSTNGPRSEPAPFAHTHQRYSDWASCLEQADGRCGGSLKRRRVDRSVGGERLLGDPLAAIANTQTASAMIVTMAMKVRREPHLRLSEPLLQRLGVYRLGSELARRSVSSRIAPRVGSD